MREAYVEPLRSSYDSCINDLYPGKYLDICGGRL